MCETLEWVDVGLFMDGLGRRLYVLFKGGGLWKGCF
jgi:hypothetical protein